MKQSYVVIIKQAWDIVLNLGFSSKHKAYKLKLLLCSEKVLPKKIARESFSSNERLADIFTLAIVGL